MPSNPLLPQELLSFIQASAQNGINPPSLPSGYVYATPPTSDGHLYLRRFDAAYIQTGIIDPNRLGTGATGAGNLYLADDGTWKAVPGGGGGNMSTSTYDTDNSGIVDNAESISVIGRNSTGSTLYKGTIVYISGSTGNLPNFVKAQANVEATSAGTFGVVRADINNNSNGYVTTIGFLDNLDTRSSATNPFTDVTLADGDTVYLHPTIAGYITNVKPSAPNHLVYIGKVTRTSPTNGTIVYRIQNGYELDEIHDVAISSKANNDLLVYESASSLWKNKTFSAIFGGTPLVSVPTLDQVTTAGNTTTNAITVGGLTVATNLIYTDTVNGRVGFGTTSPLFKVDISNRVMLGQYPASATYGAVYLGNIAPSNTNYTLTSNSVDTYLNGTSNINFSINDVIKARIASTGNFLIATTTDAGYKLDVNGTIRSSGAIRTDATGYAISLPGLAANSGIFINSTNASLVYNTDSQITWGGNGVTIASGPGRIKLSNYSNNGVVIYNQAGSGAAYYALTVNNTTTIATTGYQVGVLAGSLPPIVELYTASSSLIYGFNTTDFRSSMPVIIGSQSAPIGKLQVTGSITAASLLAQGVYFNNTLVAAANNDVLVGLDINPTFTNGAFTGVTNVALRTQTGNVLLATTSGNVGIGTTSPAVGLDVRNGFNLWVGTGHYLEGVAASGTDASVVFRRATNNGWVRYALGVNANVSFGANISTGEVQLMMPFGGFFQTFYANGSEAMRIPTTRNVLIGTTTDAGYKLDVVGADSRFNGVRVGLGAGGVSTNTVVGNGALNSNLGAGTGFSVTAIGYQALQTSTSGYQNTALGYQTLKNVTTASDCVAVGALAATNTIDASANTAVGSESLLNNTYGQSNTAVGYRSLYSSIIGTANVAFGRQALNFNTGSYNTAIGYQAAFNNTSSVELTAIGYYALRSNTTGGQNTAVGSNALYSNTTGNTNSALGYNTLYNNTIGTNNSALGHLALFSNTTGNTNSAFGYLSLTTNTTGSNNVAIGVGALRLNTTGIVNTAVGVNSLQANTTGIENAAFGVDSLRSNTTGSSNTSVGANALFSSTASNNTALGYQAGQAGVANTTGANNIFIGYQSTGVSATESNRTWIGNPSTTSTWLAGNVLIGTTTDAGYKLDVSGTARFQGFTTVSATTLVNGDAALTIQSTTNNSVVGQLYGINNIVTASTNVSNISGINSAVNTSSSASLMAAVQGQINISANTLTEGKGFTTNPAATGTGTFTRYIGFDNLAVFKAGSGSVGTQIFLRSQYLNAAANNIGLLLQDAAAATVVGNWAIHDKSGYNSYFSGNMGIGTTNPIYPLHISSAAAANIYGTVQSTNANGTAAWVAFNDQSDNVVYRVFGSGASGTQMGIALARTASLIANLGGAGSFLLGTYSATNFIMGTGNAEKMRIVDSTGNILIATTTDLGNKLEVSGSINSTGYKINNTAGYTGTLVIVTNPPGQQNVDIQGGIIVNVF